MRRRIRTTCTASIVGMGLLLSLSVGAQQTKQEVGASPTAQAHFDVQEFRVLGNSLLSRRTIESAVYSFAGPGRTAADVQAARSALEDAYRAAGYGAVFVDVPEQDVTQGVVRLKVTEGKLDRVRVVGAQYFSARDIKSAIPAATSGMSPHVPSLQSQLSSLNQVTRDRAVTPVMKMGRTPGTVDLDLRVVEDLPLHGSLSVNDRYTADTSRSRIGASLSYDNLLQRAHSIALQYQVSPEEPSETQVWAATYALPIPDTGWLLALYAVRSDSDVAAIGALSVLGKGRIQGVRAIRRLPGNARFSQSLTLGLDHKDFLEDIRLDVSNGLLTPIEYWNASLLYSGALRGESTNSSFDLGLGLGPRRLGTTAQEFADKRFKGRSNYWYLRSNIRHTRNLPTGFSVAGRLSWQYAPAPLISNEQFSMGGAESVRGYLEAQEFGDYGFSASLELHSPSLLKYIGGGAKALDLFAFYDVGVTSIHDPLPENGVRAAQTDRFDLASVGLGLRFLGYHGLDLALDWAYPLVSADTVDAGDDRLHFDVRYNF
ncbi:MAG: ShlB/FhaC/HecB family hemolysin secretion/activation protein [Steroidobacteraceae bacterium]